MSGNGPLALVCAATGEAVLALRGRGRVVGRADGPSKASESLVTMSSSSSSSSSPLPPDVSASVAAADYEVVLRDLEPMLRRSLGRELDLLEFECSPLVKTGDNYGSTILGVRAVVQWRDAGAGVAKPAAAAAAAPSNDVDDDRREVHELVAKMLPATELSRRIFDVDFSFRKEVFVYEDLLPTYQSLYEAGGGAAGGFEVAPSFYGSRLSLREDADELDGDAVILMENLKAKGYYMMDRRRGLDLAHLKVALSTLAKFHAVGLAVKHKKPSYLGKLRKYGKPLPLQVDLVRSILEDALADLAEHPPTRPYVERIRASGDLDDLDATYRCLLEPDDPWACVAHDDFWINNMMFRRDGAPGPPADAKIVDFQTYCLSSPLGDLVFFLCTSMEASMEAFDEAIEFYRRATRNALAELDCPDDSLLARDRFGARLVIDAARELYHLLLMAKVVELREGESLNESPLNEHCLRRLTRIVEIYVDRNWI